MKTTTLGLLLTLGAACAQQRCATPQLNPGLHSKEITVDGTKRQFYVSVPTDAGTTERPAIMMFHGCGSSPEKFEFESSMSVRANTGKYYLIYPRGTDASGGASPRLGWNAGFSQCNTRGAVNDVNFAKAVHTWANDNLCVDRERIFASGFSNGGSMVFNLTCEMNDYFAGFAYTGSTMPPAAYPISDTCNGGLTLEQIKPILGVCGSNDGCGSTITPWFRNFAAYMECGDDALETKVTATTTCTEHKQCGAAKNSRLEYCTVNNLGHCWSRGGGCCDAQCMNQNSENFDLSSKVLAFFDAVVVPGSRPVATNATESVVAAPL